MNKLAKAIVVTSKRDLAVELMSGAHELAECVIVITFNMDCAINADIAYVIDAPDASMGACAADIADIVEKEAPQLVIAEATRDGRLFSAIIAARYSTSVLTDCISLSVAGGQVTSSRMTYGGRAIKHEHVQAVPAVACVGYGVFPAGSDAPAAEIRRVEPAPSEIKMISSSPKQILRVNLGSAKRVVGVGRGVGDGSRLFEIEEFSEKLGAEMACTRPVAEEEHLMPKERYVGVTGSTIKPDLYLALGISGVIQHMAGVNSSGTIVAINKDKNAPIFQQCDYGIVGDIFEAVKLISGELNK